MSYKTNTMLTLVEEIRDILKEGTDYLQDNYREILALGRLETSNVEEYKEEIGNLCVESEEKESKPPRPLHPDGVPHSFACPCDYCEEFRQWHERRNLPVPRIEYNEEGKPQFLEGEVLLRVDPTVDHKKDTPKLDQEKALHPEVYKIINNLIKKGSCPLNGDIECSYNNAEVDCLKCWREYLKC